MRKIIAAEFITLDGVVEAPGSGDTTLPDKRGWSMPYTNDEVIQVIFGQMDASDAMLLGRTTYEGFATFWSAMPADNPIAQRMNNQNKYVVSTTLQKADWTNSTLIKGDVAAELTKLKQQPGKNIAITGSGTLVFSLLQMGLVDELQLMVCPVILGVGKRLFQEGFDTQTLKLINAQSFSSGMVLLTYHPDNAQ
jgi:dihydrofolate reductase